LGSIMLLLAAIAVWLLPRATFSKAMDQFSADKFQEFLKKLKEGYEFIKNSPAVLFPLLLLVFSQIIITMIFVLAPALVVKVLGMNLVNISEYFILPGGLGAILGMALTVRFLKRIRKRYLIHVGLFLASFALFSLVLVVPHLSHLLKLISQIGFGFLGGLSFSLFVIPGQTLLQEKTPIELRGRIFGVLSFLITLAAVFPVLFSATIGEFLGERWMFLILAFIVFLLGLFSLKGENLVKSFYRS